MTADGIDLLALASHKLGGPTGVGALVVRPGTSLRPLVHGGGQERGLRSGTLPAAALAGFGAAAAAALADRHTGTATTLAALRSRLLAGLRALAPDLEINGDPGPAGARGGTRSRGGCRGCCRCGSRGGGPKICCLLLDRHGVACSAGSACASGAVTPSHVLVAMGRDPVAARETVRFSLGHASTQADVDAAVAAVAQALEVLTPARGRRTAGAARPDRPGRGRRIPTGRGGAAGGGRVTAPQVLVAMSGGVDSSVAAALAVEAGWDVTGVHLKLADTPGHLQVQGKGCCTLADADDARRVAGTLGHPVLRLGHGRGVPAGGGRRLRRRVRRRPHPEPVRPLQRAGQGGRAAGPGPRPRLRRPGHRPLRPGRGRPAVPGGRCRQGPVVRAVHARPGRAGAAAPAAGRADQAGGAGDRGPPRPADRGQAGVLRRLLRPRRRHRRVAGAPLRAPARAGGGHRRPGPRPPPGRLPLHGRPAARARDRRPHPPLRAPGRAGGRPGRGGGAGRAGHHAPSSWNRPPPPTAAPCAPAGPRSASAPTAPRSAAGSSPWRPRARSAPGSPGRTGRRRGGSGWSWTSRSTPSPPGRPGCCTTATWSSAAAP